MSKLELGLAVCDLDQEITTRQEYLTAINNLLTLGIPVEIQNELFLSEIDLQVNSQRTPFGLHQSIMRRDLVAKDREKRNQALEDTKLTMDISQKMGADYFVVHLTQQDNWEDLKMTGDIETARANVLALALEQFATIAQYHADQHHSYKLLLEVPLEYPKHPASDAEILAVIAAAIAICPDVGLVFDVAHHWHNQFLLPGGEVSQDYTQSLEQILTEIENNFPGRLNLFHLGQAYIEPSTNVHETHGLPGLKRGEDILKLNLDSMPADFNDNWLEMAKVLQVITMTSKAANRDIKIILEVNNYSIPDKLIALTALRKILLLEQ